MEKQYSVKFFTTFVDNLQRSCQKFVSFGQLVEVSGFLSLEIDGVRKERYVLCELVQNTGNVISESFCTKVSRNFSTGLKPPGVRGPGNMPQANQVSPVVRRNAPQTNTGVSRMGLNTASNIGQSQRVNRTGQGQVNRTPQNPQVNRIGQRQQAVRSGQVPGQTFQRREQSPLSGPRVTQQRQSQINSAQVIRQNTSRPSVADCSSKQSFPPRLNQNANIKPDGNTVNNSTVSNQGRILQQIPNSFSQSKGSVSQVVQQSQPQSKQMNSPAPAPGQVPPPGQTYPLYNQTHPRPGDEAQGFVPVKAETDDLLVVSVTPGHSQVSAVTSYKGLHVGNSASEYQRTKMLPQSSQLQPGVKVTAVPSKQIDLIESSEDVSQDQNITRLVPSHDASSTQKLNVVPAPVNSLQQTQSPSFEKAPLRRRHSEVCESTSSQEICARKSVFLENQCQRSPLATSALASTTTSTENLVKYDEDFTNTENETLPDIENVSSLEASKTGVGCSVDSMPFFAEECSSEDVLRFSKRASPFVEMTRESVTHFRDSTPCVPVVSAGGQSTANVPYLAPPAKQGTHVLSAAIVAQAKSSVSTTQRTSRSRSSTPDQGLDSEKGVAKKRKVSPEMEQEEMYQSTLSTVLVCKPAKRGPRKTKEKAEKKSEKKGKKGRRKSSKPKKADPCDMSSDEDNCDTDISQTYRTLRSARNPVRRLYAEDDYLSDGLTEFLIKDTESKDSAQQI